MTDQPRAAIAVALGGNAISPEGEEGNIEQQFRHARRTMKELVRATHGRFDRVLLTHGNGPQIGNILLRSEVASSVIYPLPLDTCVSDSEGGMGYMLQQVLHNVLLEVGEPRPVASILTQTVVNIDDPNFKEPTKYIGQFYDENTARRLVQEHGWEMRQDGVRGWRRVVASPMPLEIVELPAIRALLESGTIVIAAGGGGIPVVRDKNQHLCGVEAVVDKDLASALLANRLDIPILVILTGVEKVAVDFGKPNQRWLEKISCPEADDYLMHGQFPPGSMGPKIKAALNFIRGGGDRVIITHPQCMCDALAGRTGTTIVA